MNMLNLIDSEVGVHLSRRLGNLCHTPDLNKGIVFAPEEIALRVHAEHYSEDILDFISYYRESQMLDWERATTRGSKNGLYTSKGTNDKYLGYKAIPVKLGYNLQYWTKYKTKANDFIKEILFWQYENPQIIFNFADENIQVAFDLFIQDLNEITNNWFDQGRYFKEKVSIEVQGWLFKEISVGSANRIILDIYDSESEVLLSEREVS